MYYDDEDHQREQYELELYRQQSEEQARQQEYEHHYQQCLYIANRWLMGECTFEEAEQYLNNAGDRHGLLSWAEDVVNSVLLDNEESTPPF